MEKILVMFIAGLVCYGCGNATVSGPDEVRSTTQVQEIVIDGFGEEPCLFTGARMVRVGSYYDISSYDSIHITFSATRLATDRPFDEILVKIGPATYLRDTLYAMQTNVLLSVRVSTISKPGFCAFTFWSLDPLTELSLSNLRVVGWVSE